MRMRVVRRSEGTYIRNEGIPNTEYQRDADAGDHTPLVDADDATVDHLEATSGSATHRSPEIDQHPPGPGATRTSSTE
jgi:hypothetical protein